MDFKQLRSFIAVIRYGSFTTAAAKLRISQPTVSTHIRQLEEELGTPLVMRNAKRIELTASGYKMYDQAVSMLAMHDKMLQSMRRHEADAIYLGASTIPSGYILPKLLASFCEEHPDARFVISQESSQTVINGMLTGLYDLGFVGMSAKEDTLESASVFSDKIVIVTPNTPRFRSVDPDDFNQIVDMLRTEHLIRRKTGSATRATANHVFEAVGLDESALNVIAMLDDQEATKNLVECGLGIAMISEVAVKNRVEAGRMLAFEVPGVDSSRQFYVLRRKNVPLNDLAEKLYSYAASWDSRLS